MRTIPEVCEDIKSILNNIERTENCDRETLFDIDELVNEILIIRAYKTMEQTNFWENNRYLYRAKRMDNGEWVEGLLWKKKYNSNKIFISCFPDKDDNEEVFVVDKNTICQCTGLKDKNGKLIWENDILRAHLDDEFPENITYKTVIWRINGFYSQENKSIDYDQLDEFDEEHFEVCGNIFDNPELLEV